MNITSIVTRKNEVPAEESIVTVPLQAVDKPATRNYELSDDRFANAGYHEAVESGANPDTYQLMLRHALRSVEAETHDVRDINSREAAQLQEELAALARDESQIKEEAIPALNEERRKVEERHDEVLQDPTKLAAGEKAYDETKKKVAYAGVLALSGFLYIFYFIIGHAAFVRNIGKGLEAADTGSVISLFESVFDASAIVRDFVDSPLNLLICLFFPLVFMVVGYLFHEFRDQGRAHLAWGCLAVIVGLDFTLAYKVTAKMHEARFLTGLTDEKWRFFMIFSDVNFYMILLSGLAVYLIWGALLALYFEEKRRCDRVAAFLSGCREKIASTDEKIRKAGEQLTAIGMKIKEKRVRASQLDEPGILAVFPWHRVEQVMDSFTAGWSKGVAAHYKGAHERLSEEERLRSGELPVILEGSKNAIRQAFDTQQVAAVRR